MRALELDQHLKVILSDTVGFISDLPTHLVAAFRATLEEVEQADIILHVRDIASDHSEGEAKDVLETLETLELEISHNPNIIEVWNKIDLLDAENRERIFNVAERQENVIAISALKEIGLSRLKEILKNKINKSSQIIDLKMKYSHGDVLSWVYENCAILNRQDKKDGIYVQIQAAPDILSRLQHKEVEVL